MKKGMKKFISAFLVLTFCFTLGTSAIAYDTDSGFESTSSEYTFFDSEGKENTLETSVLSNGQVVTTLYIEGDLIATTTTQYNEETRQIHISRVDNEGFSINKTVHLSNIIVAETSSPMPMPHSTAGSYAYKGRINYKPYYGENLKISVYTSLVSAREHDETFFAAAGTLVDVAIGGLASYLVTLHQELGTFAATLGGSLLVAGGAVVVAGVIKETFVQEYHVNDWNYDIKTVASDSGAEQIYHDNHAYQFFLEGEIGEENLSEIMPFDYLEWDDDGVATQFFCDFWGVGNCPGIKSYTYA